MMDDDILMLPFVGDNDNMVIQDLRNKLFFADEEHRGTKEQLHDVRTRLRDSLNRTRELANDNTVLKQRVAVLEANAIKAVGRRQYDIIAQKDDEIVALRRDFNKLLATHENLKSSIGRYIRECADGRRQIKGLKDDIHGLETKMLDMRCDLFVAQNDAEEARRRERDAKMRSARLEVRVQHLEARAHDLEIETQQLREKVQPLECGICMERQRNIVITGCGHIAACSICVPNIRPKKCPICRQSFNGQQCKKVFFS